MKNKSYLFRNLGYGLRWLWKRSGIKAYAACISDVVLGAAFPFLGMALPSAIVALLLSGRKAGEVLLLLTGYLVLFQSIRILQTRASGEKMKSLFLFRQKVLDEFCEKCVWIDAQFFESDEGQKKSENAGRNIFEGDQTGIQEFLSAFFSIGTNLCGMAVYAVIIGRLNLTILLVLILMTIVVAVINNMASKKGNSIYEDKGGYWDKLRDKMYLERETIVPKNGKDIRLYRLKSFFLDAMHKNCRETGALMKKLMNAYVSASMLEKVLAFLRDAAIYWYLIDCMVQGKIEIGAFLLYVGTVAGFEDWMTGVFERVQSLLQNNVVMNQYVEFMQSGIVETEGKKLPHRAGEAHEIRLENVCFRYDGAEEDVLHNVNLTVHTGEKLALVGVNGAGKTTLVKIISGLYKPTSGKVYLDGEDVSELNPFAYYKEFSVVFQDVFAFSFPLADNVSCKTPEETDASRLEDCLKKADLWEKVQSLEKGVQTVMNKDLDKEGVLLSGGEMQKLMLARALYKEAPVVILDEPTAALDPIAESEMYQRYHELTEGKTSIFISHRLSSTRFCNRILFLENGSIAEEGSHEELMERQGSYANMFTVQAQYYQKEPEEKEESCYA